MHTRRVLLGSMIAVAAVAGNAFGDPSPVNLHMRTPSTITTDGGSVVKVPPGYYLDEPTHDKLDAEVKRLQEAETRLKAENTSFRTSAASWQPGWWTLAVTLASGIALGAYIEHRL